MKVLGKTLLAVWTIVEVDFHENGMLVATINALDEDFVCRHKLFLSLRRSNSKPTMLFNT